MNILDKIIEQKQLEIAESKKKISLIEVKDSAFFHRNTFLLRKRHSIKKVLIKKKRNHTFLCMSLRKTNR